MVKEILDNYQSILTSIQEQSEYKKDDIEKKVQKRIEQYGGLLTDAGAAYAIARELEIETGFEPAPVKISEVGKDQINLRMKFTIESIYPMVDFNKNNRSGCVQNFWVRDDSGKIRFVIWNNKDVCEKIKHGQEIIIEGAYSKENNNSIEIHSGNNCKIKLGNIVVPAEQQVLKEKTFSDATENDFVSGEGIIENIYPVKEFQKANGTGKLASINFKTGDKTYRLVFWDDKAQLTQNFKSGDRIKLANIKARYNKMRNEIEFHFNYNSKIEYSRIPPV